MSSSRFLFPEIKLYSFFSYYRVACHQCKFSFSFIDPQASYNSTPEVRQHIEIKCPNCQHPPCLKCKVPIKSNGIELVSGKMNLPVFHNTDENGIPDEEPVWPFLCNTCGELQPLKVVHGDKISFKNAVCCFCTTKVNYETLCWREESQIPPPEEPKTPITLQGMVGRARSTSKSMANRARSASATAKSAIFSAIEVGKSAAHEIKDKVEDKVQRSRGESFKLNSIQRVETNLLRDYAVEVTESKKTLMLGTTQPTGDVRRNVGPVQRAPVVSPGFSAPILSYQPHPQSLMPGWRSRYDQMSGEYECDEQDNSNYF